MSRNSHSNLSRRLSLSRERLVSKKKPIPKGTGSGTRGATLFGALRKNQEHPKAEKENRRESKSQAVDWPASHSESTGFPRWNPIPPPVNGGEPAQATTTLLQPQVRPTTPGAIRCSRQDQAPTYSRFSAPAFERLLFPFSVFVYRLLTAIYHVLQALSSRASCLSLQCLFAGISHESGYFVYWAFAGPHLERGRTL